MFFNPVTSITVLSNNCGQPYTEMHQSSDAFCYFCLKMFNIKLKEKVSITHDVLTVDHSSDLVFIYQSLWPLSTIYHSILCSASSMPWQQIKLKSAWKKEALKCCHMQDCMGTS